MDKGYYQSKIKSVGGAYLFLFVCGLHYFYLGKILKGILFVFTLGGFGLWWLYDLFTLAGRISKHNRKMYSEIDKIEKRERREEREYSRDEMMAMVEAMKTSKPKEEN